MSHTLLLFSHVYIECKWADLFPSPYSPTCRSVVIIPFMNQSLFPHLQSPWCSVIQGPFQTRYITNSTLKKLQIHSISHRHFIPLILALATFLNTPNKVKCISLCCAVCCVSKDSGICKSTYIYYYKRPVATGSRLWLKPVETGPLRTRLATSCNPGTGLVRTSLNWSWSS